MIKKRAIKHTNWIAFGFQSIKLLKILLPRLENLNAPIKPKAKANMPEISITKPLLSPLKTPYVRIINATTSITSVSYTHLRAHET